MFVILPNAFGDAPTNMAIDAALLETIPERQVIFRHYGWTEPAMTFGYSQHHREVATLCPDGVALCRRMSGGGIVDHRNDWTYALVIQKDSPTADISSTDLYSTVHAALANALAEQKIATQLAPCPRKCEETVAKPDGPDQCFIQPVMNDVLTPDGRKIAGAAMKRTKKGLLIQGSIDRAALLDALNYTLFQDKFIKSLTSSLALTPHEPDDLRPYFKSDTIEVEKEKFRSIEWTNRR